MTKMFWKRIFSGSVIMPTPSPHLPIILSPHHHAFLPLTHPCLHSPLTHPYPHPVHLDLYEDNNKEDNDNEDNDYEETRNRDNKDKDNNNEDNCSFNLPNLNLE